ncbi:MAG: SDR family oxidoreductase [Candidatus Hydrogenedentota bacterium]|nr:MAG: SDR family oxidoreductase [Candidatus Hydrogenedentota bacterium]
MEKYALVTGAAGGIGKAFCELLQNQGYSLFITGRNAEKLVKWKTQLESLNDVNVHAIDADLSLPQGREKIMEYAEQKNLNVSVLVNNAGFGLTGEFVDRPLQKWKMLNEVNVNAVTELTWYFGKKMKEKKDGIIINISSLAAFQAIPWFAAYAASKAYVLSFTEALAEELEPYNIVVTAVCPGPVKTDFVVSAEAAHIEAPDMLWADPEFIAKESWKSVKNKDRVCVPGAMNKATLAAQKIIPRTWVSKLAGSFYKPKK